jgi:hypothetical protein
MTDTMNGSLEAPKNSSQQPLQGAEEELFGIDTAAVLHLGHIMTDLHVLPPKAHRIVEHLPDALQVLPLIERMTTENDLTPEDVRPYNTPIKRLVSRQLGGLIFRSPLEKIVDYKIEHEFPARATKLINEARTTIESLEDDVDFAASFENPKQQFIDECDTLRKTVIATTNQVRDERIANKTQQALETPKGLLGVAVRVVRAVKRFFGMFSRKQGRHETTAYDVGTAVHRTIKTLTDKTSDVRQAMPLVSRFIIDRIPLPAHFTPYTLSIAAPELLQLFSSLFKDDAETIRLKKDIDRNPHELRFVSHYKRQFGRYSLGAIQSAANTLLPAVRDVLPSDGSKIRSSYEQILNLSNPQTIEQTTPTKKTVLLKQTIRNQSQKAKTFFGKFRKKPIIETT